MSDAVPFLDLRAQYRAHREAIDAAIARVIGSCGFILGAEVETLEAAFAAHCGTRHAVGVGTGLDALRLILLELGIGPGDEVLLPANTFIATALAVSAVGARPVLVDCRDEDFCLDPNQIASKITSRTRALLPVHLYGLPAPMAEIQEVANRHDLLVVEDACQAHGARLDDGRPCGSLGRAAAFSFYPGKNLGAYGDGGAITTDDDELAARLRLRRNYGQVVKYQHSVAGENCRLDAIQAAILGAKLPFLDRGNALRRRVASRYIEAFAGSPVLTPRADQVERSVWHLFVVQVEDREDFRAHLKNRGIETGIHYPVPIHLQTAYSYLAHAHGDFPVCERLSERIVSLPIYPEMTEGQVAKVIDAVLCWAPARAAR
ncbi:MAG TPA: DegT/DnrJ/EryC1/StrS family aminotransferase [Candidatus Polarisedimenticolia bacterium]|nr:DegT/DnrJ/EryC1/StrS family aminotransferase [Candidatus Polarisedimenticolia bacterium]